MIKESEINSSLHLPLTPIKGNKAVSTVVEREAEQIISDQHIEDVLDPIGGQFNSVFNVISE